MYRKYRIVERQVSIKPETPQYVYLVQSEGPPNYQNALGSMANTPPPWTTVGTYYSLEDAQNALKLIEHGLQPGDKIVG